MMELIDMVRLKDCPRCRGDVIASQDVYGVFTQCLQCGHVRELGKPKAVASKLAIDGPKKEVA